MGCVSVHAFLGSLDERHQCGNERGVPGRGRADTGDGYARLARWRGRGRGELLPVYRLSAGAAAVARMKSVGRRISARGGSGDHKRGNRYPLCHLKPPLFFRPGMSTTRALWHSTATAATDGRLCGQLKAPVAPAATVAELLARSVRPLRSRRDGTAAAAGAKALGGLSLGCVAWVFHLLPPFRCDGGERRYGWHLGAESSPVVGF